MTRSLLSSEQLKRQLRVQLAQGRLPIASGAYKARRGTGRPCIVCLGAIEPTEVEYEVDRRGLVLVAHESCHVLWREESRSAPC
jgi:hypothetical protein